jgi:gluconolactonase
MMIWSEAEGLKVWREKVDFTNGHTLDHFGNLLHCSHGQRAIIRTRFGVRGVAGAGGPVALRDCIDEVLVSHYQGGRLNSPNDLVVKSDGTIWFTDPPYGILSNNEGYKAPSEQSANYVFRLDLSKGTVDPTQPGDALTAVSQWVDEPNGLAFSPDEKVLYVSDTSAATRAGNHHIAAFDVIDGCRLANPRVFAVISPGLADGFRLDHNGWVYTSSLDSVQVYHADGTRLAVIPMPEKVGNLTFGGPNNDELFILASTSLYRIKLNARGLL